MKHILYKTSNILNGRFYIGIHSTKNPNDGYLGSGKRLKYEINKYGRESFRVEVMEILPTRKALEEREAQIVTPQLLSDPLCLNLKNGGEGGWDHLNKNSDVQRNRAIRGNEKQKLLRENPEWLARNKQARSKAMSKRHKDGTAHVPNWTGRTHSEEAKRKMSETRKRNAALKKKNAREVLAGGMPPS